MQTSVIDKSVSMSRCFAFLDLRPRAVLVRCFAKNGLKQPDEMKARETGRPSRRAYGKGLVFPIPQKIAGTAESA
jgi:hypothetical protein